MERPIQSPALNAFGANPQPATIPEEHFNAITIAITEDEKVATEGIMFDGVLGQGPEPVKPFSHVGRTRQEENTRCRA